MDFDDRFDFEEFKEHFEALHLLDDEDPNELICRTTKTTRGGNAFSFKPVHMWIGSSRPGSFHSGFDCKIDSTGRDPQRNDNDPPSKRDIASSFWVRFNELGDRFQFRIFCAEQSIAALRPYEGIIPFRDVIPGGVELRAQKRDSRVLVHLTIRARRPPRATVRLVPVIPAGYPIFDRLATEADFFQSQGYSDSDELYAGKISPLGSNNAIIKPGLWLSHRFSFDITIRQYKLFWQCMIRLRLIQLEPDLHAYRNLVQPLRLDSSQPWPAEFSPFRIRYLIEGLVSYGVVSVSELGSLRRALRRWDPSHWSLILEGLFKTHRKRSIGKDVKDVCRRIGPPLRVPPHCMYVRRCLVTPIRCLLRPPQIETSNSMLRAFKDYQDYFLRVQFVDEDEALQITAEVLTVDKQMDYKKGIFARLRRALQSGLDIAGRHYIFLCFGESQIKERGCWMISETGDFTVSAVIKWIGDLDQERVIGKHAARQGLVLSTSHAVDFEDFQVMVEPDITVETANGAKHTFTDGVGRCRQMLVNRCSGELGHNWRQFTPSAVQVRIGGGIKGVLCVVPDTQIDEDTVMARKSMVKFKSDNTTLNVLKVATYGVAYLNRQAILLLEAQGVPLDTLLQLFAEEKGRIEGLEARSQEEHIATLTTFPLAQAIAVGFTHDPLVQNIIRVLKCRLLGDLKWKARIPVEKGTYLMGVADETRTLQEGEIFCQVERLEGRQVITGDCTVYRNPCLHPGDVRLVKAVDNPALAHLKNVVVFSTWGTRDLPSMMGGGDLDGDFYTLLWDERLVIPRQHEPMDYTPPPPKTIPSWQNTVTIDDTKEFFLEYLQSDILGMICNAHLALADQHDPAHPDCLAMAKLASQAVDFSKTGVPVDRETYVPPESYPDFMGKDQTPKTDQLTKKKPARTHKSEKALGYMFRSIDPDPVFEPADPEVEAWEPAFIQEPPSNQWEQYLEAAADLKTRYDFELSGVLRTYNIREAECVAGVLLRSRKRRVRVERDYSLRMAVQDAYKDVTTSFIAQAAEHLSHPIADNSDKAEERRAWAFACYKVTYDKAWYDAYCERSVERHIAEMGDPQDDSDDEDEDDEADSREDAPMERRYSFPWLFINDLLALTDGGR